MYVVMPSARADARDDGFTMVELIVAIGLAAFLFTALAAVMVASLGAVGVQKSRTQANAIATVGIEDLQRLAYNSLGLCDAPTGPAAPELADTVLLPNCGASPVKYGPCEAGSQPANAVPAEQYTCVRRSIGYVVRRYISYGDVAHTEKRLAVVVDWDDEGGKHRVAQQSSLRIPSQNAIIGNPPPTLSAGATGLTPNLTGLDAGGSNADSLTLNAQTDGLVPANGDTVIAVFDTVGTTGRQQQSIDLVSTGPTTWQKVVAPGTLRLGPGTQFVTFTATRLKDGKVNSLIASPAFTISGSVPFPPTMTVTKQPPATATLNAQGDLLGAGFEIEVLTTNISPADGVSMTFETATGAVSLALQPDPYVGGGCTTSSCQTSWRATIAPSSGYHFLPGDRYFYIVGRQLPPGGSFPVDSGGTVAAVTTKVTFT